jgi:hypothetical protein
MGQPADAEGVSLTIDGTQPPRALLPVSPEGGKTTQHARIMSDVLRPSLLLSGYVSGNE